MRPVTLISLVLLALLQYRLWFGNGSMREVWQLQDDVAAQETENNRLLERNRSLAAEVLDLKQGEAAIEERARSEMGMIRRDEIFYQIMDYTSANTGSP